MFKFLTIGFLIYLFYRLVFVQKTINAPQNNIKINKKKEDPQNSDEGDYIDYEEID